MNTITMHPVDSSQISAIGYDSAEKVLAIQFSRGGLYHYLDVPQEKFDALLGSDSVGRYHAQHIKGAHPFKKLDAETVNGATAA